MHMGHIDCALLLFMLLITACPTDSSHIYIYTYYIYTFAQSISFFAHHIQAILVDIDNDTVDCFGRTPLIPLPPSSVLLLEQELKEVCARALNRFHLLFEIYMCQDSPLFHKQIHIVRHHNSKTLQTKYDIFIYFVYSFILFFKVQCTQQQPL